MAQDEEKVRQDQRAYRLCFGSPAGAEVLLDLAQFCRAHETCVHADLNGTIDIHKTFLLEGRREVWIRVQQRLNLTTEQLAQLYLRVPITLTEDDNG